MVTVNKSILTTNLVFLVIGIGLGYLLFHKAPVASTVTTQNTETTETTHTVQNNIEVDAVSPGKVTKEKLPEFAEVYFEAVPEVKNNVAKWDTLTADGFEAHVKYFIEQNLFVNNFKYPERIVYKDKIVTTTSTEVKTEIVTELPAFMFGGGVKAGYDDKLKVMPFLHLAANTKLWFFIASVEARALIDNSNLQINIKPEIEGKLSIGL